MALLTDRFQITAVTNDDLIHVVDVADTSQNAAGSSYKATIQQVIDIVPFVTGGTHYPSGTTVFNNRIGGTFQISGYGKLGTTVITTATATLTTNYTYYGVNYTGNVDLTIPDPTGIDGFNFHVKDESGNASIYRIRLTPAWGTIDGYSYVDMNSNFMSLHLVARNNIWRII